MKIEYREALPDPLQYKTLFDSTGWNARYGANIEELQSALKASWHTVCASDADNLVGFGRVVSDGVLYAVIFDLIVAPEYQRRGIGRQMLNRLIDKCRAAGIRDIQLFCAEGKIDFYRKAGFTVRPAGAPGMRLTADV